MALILVTGVAGTGKTLYCIQKYIIPELKKGQLIYTNIDGLLPSRIAIFFNIDIFQVEANLKQLSDVSHFWKELPTNALCVIDEAQNVFNNRAWQAKENIECIEYLMEHRHYGHRVVMITPHIESLDAGIRRVCEFTYKHKSFSAIGNSKQVRCAVFDQANITKPALQHFSWRHDENVYQCYKSYFEKDVNEKKVRVNPFANATLIFLIVIIGICFTFAFINSSKFIKKMEGRAKKNHHSQVLSSSKENHKRSGIILINGKAYEGK